MVLTGKMCFISINSAKWWILNSHISKSRKFIITTTSCKPKGTEVRVSPVGISSINMIITACKHRPCVCLSWCTMVVKGQTMQICLCEDHNMIMSSKGNIFRVTGHLCGNSPVTGEFPAQRPVTRSFDGLFDLCLRKGMCKQSWGW